jgi:cyclopropane fatty-acyl-phospholipid synthase-like methyltransferase
MLARARQRFPQARYSKKSMHEIDYRQAFDGVICIDALEHVFPEDWPVIVAGFRRALKAGGWLYFTLDVSATDRLEEAYQAAKSQELPVVFGEWVAELQESYDTVMSMPLDDIPGELADKAVYHYYPSLEQVRAWLDQEDFTIKAEDMGKWYRHFLVRQND